jgi:hypothetical protein
MSEMERASSLDDQPLSPGLERTRATVCALLVTLSLTALIVLGARNLANIDVALLCYMFATLFAAFGVTYRWVLWVQRPPTAVYWRRGRQLLLSWSSVRHLVRQFLADFVLNRFIWRRGVLRGAAHWLIMWGCVGAVAITFPLVFGWIHFKTLPDNPGWYQVCVFGMPHFSFRIKSFIGFVLFHGLVWTALMVIAGVVLAMRRRLRDHGVGALQQFGEDFLPLILLFAISVTGLMLTVSYTWMRGSAYDFLAILHAATVIFTLLWLPFGKLFHVFQRPAHLAVGLYKEAGRQGEQAQCRRCDQPFASRMHVEDLIEVERQLGYRYQVPETPQQHYQWICPRCRRALLALAQGQLWDSERGVPELP